MADIISRIGHTPLLHLDLHGVPVDLRIKLESANPSGSVKDRAALAMVEDAENRGILRPGGEIIEATSGNLGISLAMIAAARGYACTIVMPDSMSPERRRLMAAYGADVVLTDGAQGMSGSVRMAEALHRQCPGSVLLGQFSNPANPLAHERTTGPEILTDTSGQIAAFVAGIGTGGTFTGVGRCLKAHDRSIRIVGVEPAESPLLTQGRTGTHGIQGIGANFIPENFDPAVVDELLPVRTADALSCVRMLAREHGILAGISSGAALWAGMQLGLRPEFAGRTIVILLPDSGERYLSAGGFD